MRSSGVIVLGNATRKKEKELDAERKYCNTMIAACTEFLEAEREKAEVTEEDTDGRA